MQHIDRCTRQQLQAPYLASEVVVRNIRVDKALIPVHKAVPHTLQWQMLSFTDSSIAVGAQHCLWKHQEILQ